MPPKRKREKSELEIEFPHFINFLSPGRQSFILACPSQKTTECPVSFHKILTSNLSLRTRATFGLLSSQTTSTIHLPQRPSQAHLQCYLPTRIVDSTSDNTFQTTAVGNPPQKPLTSRKSFLVVQYCTYFRLFYSPALLIISQHRSGNL